MKRKYLVGGGLVLVGFVTGMIAQAGDQGARPGRAIPEYKLVIKDHRFLPSELTVPAHTKFKVLVTNQDSAPSEFESNDFNREKVVLPGRTVVVFIGPLDKGHYKFFDDFHQSTGNGVLKVE